MDRYKFRGKVDIKVTSVIEEHVKDGWVYGNLIGKSLIVGDVIDLNDDYFNTEFWISVKAETVGQYTGKQDFDKLDVYEHDIVMDFMDGNYYLVVWDADSASFLLVPNKGEWMDFETFEEHASVGYRVVGTKIDNKELLEE